MYLQYILIIYLGIFTIVKSQLDLLVFINKICPYSDVCNRTALRSLNVKGLEPCCSSCRCDEKCGLRQDCCFEEMDKYHLKENGFVACITPFSTEDTKYPFYGSYWMIKACNYESFETSRSIPCELYDEKGNYLLEPVSSKETNSIFINKKCALCNNVYNFTKWNFLILKPYQQVGPSEWEMDNDQNNHSAAAVYIPPKEEKWSVKRCFSEFQDTCNINSTLGKLCHTLNMPYVHNSGVRFKNALCYLCKYGKTVTTQCKEDSGRTTNVAYTVLIDSSVVSPSELHQSAMINKRLKSNCQKDDVVQLDLKSCLPLYCPNGMLMTPTGCRYFIQRWNILSFSIQFKLLKTGGNELYATTLDALSFEERRNPALWLKLPCTQGKADVLDVYFEAENATRHTIKSFIVRLLKSTKNGIDPSYVLPTMQKCLKYKWYIKISGKSFTFRATLDKYSTYVQDGQQKRINKLNLKTESATRPELYRKLVAAKQRRTTIILKTFFCDQVNLPMDAVEVLFGEMRILSTNVTLGNNEFAVNFFQTHKGGGKYITDLNKTTFSVCIEDYDTSYNQRRSASALSSRIIALGQFVQLFIILQSLM